MNVKLTKSEVARIAQALIITQVNNQDALTPMAMTVRNATENINTQKAMEIAEKHLRVARYLGWNVCKRNNHVYENGYEVWSTSGN